MTDHPFERAGMGKAPFKLLKVETTEDRAAENSHRRANGLAYTTNLCGGTCEYCGTAIWNVYWIESSDGRKSMVGSECVLKTSGEGDKLAKKVKTHRNKLKRESDKRRKSERIEGAVRLLGRLEVRRELRNRPHSKGWQGKTMLDEVRWYFRNAGETGKFKMAKEIEKLVNS